MKTIISVVLFSILLTIQLLGQGWNSIVTTSIDCSTISKIKTLTNKDGIHIITKGDYSDSYSIKYALINSSGSTVQTYSFDTGGDFPNISGDGTSLCVCYKKSSTIKTWKSTDAGANWSDGAIDDITLSNSNCNGIDLNKDDRGLHIVYATWDNQSDGYETYYRRNYSGSGWVDFKNVTDYETEEIGGFPSVTTSTNKVHVSYNTGTESNPENNADGFAKSRDYNFQTEEWEDPQQVYGYPDGYSMVEKMISFGSDIHLFFYKYVYQMGNYGGVLYDTKRSVSGTTWSTPTQISPGYTSLMNGNIAATTIEGKLYVMYTYIDLYYKVYDGSSWGSAVDLSESSYYTGLTNSMTSLSNDLYVIWRPGSGSYLKYRQYDAAPFAPQNIAVSAVADGDESHPRVTWTCNSEPDVYNYSSAYQIWRSTGPLGLPGGTYYQITTVSGSTSSYIDHYITSAGNGNNAADYKIKAVDVNSNASDFTSSVRITWGPGEESRKCQVVRLTPNEYSIDQNYPNPFNPSTTIEYALPKDGHVLLKIYNALGQEVATPVNGIENAGYKSVVFNASGLGSGIYYCRLSANGKSMTKPMLLMK